MYIPSQSPLTRLELYRHLFLKRRYIQRKTHLNAALRTIVTLGLDLSKLHKSILELYSANNRGITLEQFIPAVELPTESVEKETTLFAHLPRALSSTALREPRINPQLSQREQLFMASRILRRRSGMINLATSVALNVIRSQQELLSAYNGAFAIALAERICSNASTPAPAPLNPAFLPDRAKLQELLKNRPFSS